MTKCENLWKWWCFDVRVCNISLFRLIKSHFSVLTNDPMLWLLLAIFRFILPLLYSFQFYWRRFGLFLVSIFRAHSLFVVVVFIHCLFYWGITNETTKGFQKRFSGEREVRYFELSQTYAVISVNDVNISAHIAPEHCRSGEQNKNKTRKYSML